MVEIYRDRLRGDYSACTADTWWRPVSIKGSLTRTTFPIGSTGGHTSENVAYDANDNVVSRLTRGLASISFAYDTLNRVCTKTIATSPTACTATTSASPTVWFGYDLNGRATSMLDNSAAIAAAVLPAPGTPVSYATTTSYDRLNRPVNESFSPAPASAMPTAASEDVTWRLVM